jgi:hypothetical protein
MRTLIESDLVGRKCVFDWRSAKEQKAEEKVLAPGDNRFLYGTVREVRLDCNGDLWAYLEEYRTPQSVARICCTY